VQVITTCVALGCVDWQVQVTAGGSTGPGAWSTTVGIPRVAASSLAPRACAWQVHSALAVANRPVNYTQLAVVDRSVDYSTRGAYGARRPVRQTGVSRIPATAVCMVAFQGEKYVRQTLSDCSGRRKWRRGCLSDGDGGVGGKDILTPHRVSAEVFGGAAEARHVEGETSAPDFCNSTSGAARWPVWWGGAPESSPALGRCPDACDVSEMVQ
jgi:hypothetical protein